jgi:hypothetical protein
MYAADPLDGSREKRMPSPFFSMSNVHTVSCGTPPNFVNDKPDRYHGYFENRVGEQWVFTYDRSTRKAELRGGDVGWQEVYEVVGGSAKEVILGSDELRWLEACWMAATN